MDDLEMLYYVSLEITTRSFWFGYFFGRATRSVSMREKVCTMKRWMLVWRLE
jgi:hypothetical protein